MKRGFGFVTPDGGQTMPDFVGSKTDEDSDEIGDVFLHFSEIQCTGFKFVNSEQTCKFTLYKDSRGKDAAGQVTNLDGTPFKNVFKRKRKKKKKKKDNDSSLVTSDSKLDVNEDDKSLEKNEDNDVNEEALAEHEEALAEHEEDLVALPKPNPTSA